MQPLAIETRSGRIENIHYGYMCITESNGTIYYHAGNPNTRFYLRSSAKPFIAVAIVESRALEKYGITMEELAIMCSSHSGLEYHRQTVESILNKIGLAEDALLCGSTYPYSKEITKQLIRQSKNPTPLYNCCSGKHAGMLMLCKYYGYPVENYNVVSHPVQQLILKTLTELIGCPPEDIILGVDGCTVPCYMISIYQHSYLYSLLASGYQANSKYSHALGLINEAMRKHTRMVIGDGEYGTELMQTCSSKVIGKVGDKGIYCLSIPEKNLGICVKLVDGNDDAIYPVSTSILKQLGVLSQTEVDQLAEFAYPKVTDNKGNTLGNIFSVVNIEKPNFQELTIGQKI